MAADTHVSLQPRGRLARWWRPLSLYGSLFLGGLKAKAGYRADFTILLVAAAMVQGLGYIFLWVVFQQIPEVAGWTLWEVVCIYALVFITEGFVSLFFEGIWRLNWIVNRGTFDAYLVRPVSPLLQVFVCEVGINGIGNIVLGGAMLAEALRHLELSWTPLAVAAAAGLLASAITIRLAVVVASASMAFWTGSPYTPLPLLVHSLSDFARFPLSVYGRGLQAFLTFVVPYAFVSYYPAAWIANKTPIAWVGWLTPLVAVYAMTAAVWLFRRGVRRYESAGN